MNPGTAEYAEWEQIGAGLRAVRAGIDDLSERIERRAGECRRPWREDPQLAALVIRRRKLRGEALRLIMSTCLLRRAACEGDRLASAVARPPDAR